MENGHRNSWFTHQKWWFSIVMLVCLPEGSNELGLFERSLAPQSLIWLVVDLLLWKIGESQLGLWHSQLNGQIKNVPNHQPVIDDNADALFLRMIVFNWAYISYLVGSNQNNPGNPILLWTSTSNVDLSEYYPKWSIILYRLEIATNGCCWSKFQIHPFDIAHYTCIYIYSNFHHAYTCIPASLWPPNKNHTYPPAIKRSNENSPKTKQEFLMETSSILGCASHFVRGL